MSPLTYLRLATKVRDGEYGTFVGPRTLIESIGGYDEHIVGYGGEDRDIFFRLELLGCNGIEVDDIEYEVLKHSHEDRLRFKSVEFSDVAIDTHNSLACGRLYCQIKWDIMRLKQFESIPNEFLSGLYQDCSQLVTKMISTNVKSLTYKVNIGYESRIGVYTSSIYPKRELCYTLINPVFRSETIGKN